MMHSGLIHDAGMLILDPYVEKEKPRFEQHLENMETLSQAETAVFGFTHAQLASEYLKKWQLPASRCHGQP